ncbi:MAG: acyltransferase [Acidimicrobiia bacterium]
MTKASTPQGGTEPDAASASVVATGAAGRDRLVTVARASAVLALMVVHWGLAVTLSTGLSQSGPDAAWGWTWTGWATWVFVWIGPAWFGIFGALNGRAARRSVGTFYRKRFTRLLVPYWVYAAVMLTLEFMLWAGHVGNCGTPVTDNWMLQFGPLQALSWIMPFPHASCIGIGQAPFWFMGVYLLLTLLLPGLVRIYDSRWRKWTLAAGLVLPFVFDFAYRALDLPRGVDHFSLLWIPQNVVIWGMFGFLGLYYADKTHERPEVRRWFPAGFVVFTLVTAAMTIGPWPDAMWSGSSGNQFPPTAAYMTGGLAAVCLILWQRDRLVRFSELRWTRAFVDWLDVNNYTIYIWHMTAYLVIWWALEGLGLIDVAGQYAKVVGVPPVVSQLLLFLLPWPVILVIVRIFHRCEGWDIPPKWWKRRKAARASTAASSVEVDVPR